MGHSPRWQRQNVYCPTSSQIRFMSKVINFVHKRIIKPRAVHHRRSTLSLTRGTHSHLPKLLALFLRKIEPLVPPKAWTNICFMSFSSRWIDNTPPPTIFHEKTGRRFCVKTGHIVVGVSPQRIGNCVFHLLGNIISLPHII